MKLSKVVHLYLEQLENCTLKRMKKYLKIYQKTWKNYENIMEFCQSGKVGTLLLLNFQKKSGDLKPVRKTRETETVKIK